MIRKFRSFMSPWSCDLVNFWCKKLATKQ